MSSVFNDSEELYGTTVCRCLFRRPHYSARLMLFSTRVKKGLKKFMTSVSLENLDVDFVLQHFNLCFFFFNEEDEETES